jgi:hypothetical protein
VNCQSALVWASRRARKICRRLGGDPDADTYPDKPRRM